VLADEEDVVIATYLQVFEDRARESKQREAKAKRGKEAPDDVFTRD
jgi:hypothetical protein